MNTKLKILIACFFVALLGFTMSVVTPGSVVNFVKIAQAQEDPPWCNGGSVACGVHYKHGSGTIIPSKISSKR